MIHISSLLEHVDKQDVSQVLQYSFEKGCFWYYSLKLKTFCSLLLHHINICVSVSSLAGGNYSNVSNFQSRYSEVEQNNPAVLGDTFLSIRLLSHSTHVKIFTSYNYQEMTERHFAYK